MPRVEPAGKTYPQVDGLILTRCGGAVHGGHSADYTFIRKERVSCVLLEVDGFRVEEPLPLPLSEEESSGTRGLGVRAPPSTHRPRDTPRYVAGQLGK